MTTTGHSPKLLVRRAACIVAPLHHLRVVPFGSLATGAAEGMALWSVFFSLIVSFSCSRRSASTASSASPSRAGAARSVCECRWLLAPPGPVDGRGRRAELAVPGMVVGGVIGIALGLTVLNQIFVEVGLPLVNAPVLALAAVASLAVVIAAIVSPARRAASVDPIEALRAD